MSVPFKGILGTKVGMTQVFDGSGRALPVTVIAAGPCRVTQVKTQDRDGYSAVQLGLGDVKPERLSKAVAGQFAKAGVQSCRWLKEFRVPSTEGFQVGQEMKVDVFQPGDYVDVHGITKGKGFAGVVKRHGFRGGPRTHGQSDRLRAPGSIGGSTYPGRVFKGMRMAGHMGARSAVAQRLEVVRVDLEQNLLVVGGAVPGVARGLVEVRETVKRKKVKAAPAAVAPQKAAKAEPTKKAKKAPAAASAAPSAAAPPAAKPKGS
ncbi:MAG: 50S ribosomal protein L3 [Elusimicrobia bacterium]|nr:50S ribosomal protein L3 [Elusimicrobiota bacterium]